MNVIKTLRVKASSEYDILIGQDLLENIADYIPEKSLMGTIVIITDSNVKMLYAKKVKESLEKKCANVLIFSFAAGEGSKNLAVLGEILEFLAEKSVTRTDTILALGGGVVGDIAGFAAGVYMRGISYIGVPTTFLAAIDSSVGGKTAVDLKGGKNLAGVFNQPSLVITDTNTFDTLSDEIFADGVAEALKYGIIADSDLFGKIESRSRSELMKIIGEIVYRCVEIKAEIVEGDEFDTGNRQLLNLGHTVGHAIEKYSNFSVSHGQAVAKGTAIISRAAVKQGFLSEDDAERILRALKSHSLSTNTDFPKDELYNAMLSDKKRSADSITIVIPVKIGECILSKIEIRKLQDIINFGLESK